MHVYTSVVLKSDRIQFLMYTFNRIGISFGVLRMLDIFPRGLEPGVEEDDGCVVVTEVSRLLYYH